MYAIDIDTIVVNTGYLMMMIAVVPAVTTNFF